MTVTIKVEVVMADKNGEPTPVEVVGNDVNEVIMVLKVLHEKLSSVT